jgi:cell shape-determining protein MreC
MTIPVEVAGTKVVRKMTGDGKASARIALVQKKYPVKVGSLVYTCKMAGVLDVPMVVGRISKCRADDDNPLLWEILVKPAVDAGAINTVSIIVMNP